MTLKIHRKWNSSLTFGLKVKKKVLRKQGKYTNICNVYILNNFTVYNVIHRNSMRPFFFFLLFIKPWFSLGIKFSLVEKYHIETAKNILLNVFEYSFQYFYYSLNILLFEYFIFKES